MENVNYREVLNFQGRKVVVTGGAGALGGELVLALLNCGAEVAIVDRLDTLPPEFTSRIEKEQPGSAGRWGYFQCDVLNLLSLEETRKKVEKQIGPVDSLVNAAGGNHPSASTGPYGNPEKPAEPSFFDLTEEGLRNVMDLNFLGTVFPCQVFGKGMAERREGVILNFASMNAIRPLTRIPAYSAGKAAISNFTQWFAVYMATNYSPKIRVNALAPGFFVTEQSRFLAIDPATGQLSARGRTVVAHTPMGRYGEPSELMGTALWLLSPASAFVTGIIVPVDGGFSAFSGV